MIVYLIISMTGSVSVAGFVILFILLWFKDVYVILHVVLLCVFMGFGYLVGIHVEWHVVFLFYKLTLKYTDSPAADWLAQWTTGCGERRCNPFYSESDSEGEEREGRWTPSMLDSKDREPKQMARQPADHHR